MAEISVSADSVFPILRDNILVDGFHVVIDLQKSYGSVIVDALEGKGYLDCYGYFSSLTIGHNHPKMEDEGFRSSLMTGALSNPANADIYCREYAAFVKTSREIAVPEDFRYLFFIAGGALPVENAMKVAFDWKVQKNRAAGIEGGGDRILHFRDAFHGRSGYTMSVTNTVPDIVAFGKKTRICGIMSTRRVDEVEANVFHVPSRMPPPGEATWWT